MENNQIEKPLSHETFVIGFNKESEIVFFKSYIYLKQKDEAQSDLKWVRDNCHHWVIGAASEWKLSHENVLHDIIIPHPLVNNKEHIMSHNSKENFQMEQQANNKQKANNTSVSPGTDNANAMRRLLVGQKVYFEEDVLPYYVRAANKRFVICTRKLNKRKDADLLWFEVERRAYYTFMEAYESLKDTSVYSIIDLKEKIRGTENLIFCAGFNTDKQCEQALKRLSKGESEISFRNRTKLKILKVTAK